MGLTHIAKKGEKMFKNRENQMELDERYYDEDYYLTNPRENYDAEYYYEKFFPEESFYTKVHVTRKGVKRNACAGD